MVRQTIPQALAVKAAGPVWIGAANGSCRARIGIKTQMYQRGCAPSCPVFQTGCGPPVSAEPSPGEARPGSALIARTGDNRNRHGAGDLLPGFPLAELHQIVAAHQPDKPMFGIARLQLAQRIDGIARAEFAFDHSRHDAGAAGLLAGGGEAGGERRHSSFGLERIAGRDQPPDFIKPQCFTRKQTDPAVAAMRRVKTPAQKTNRFQDLTCPVPRTNHL